MIPIAKYRAILSSNKSPSLDLNFMNGSLDSRITFTRASNATYFDATGTMQSAANNVPRFDYNPVTLALNGLLMEESRTNLLLNSATLGTQSVTTTATAATLSFYGTGTVTLSGTFTGSLVGAGTFPARNSLTFTPTAGTLTLTVTGSVLNAQLEVGANQTSYISTSGSTATRAADSAAMPLGSWFNASQGTLAAEGAFYALNAVVTTCLVELDDGTTNTIICLRNPTSGTINGVVMSASVTVGSVNTGSIAVGVPVKTALAYSAAGLVMSVGGAAPVSGSLSSVPTGLTRLSIGYGRSGRLGGPIRRIRYFPRVLASYELQQITK